MGEDNRFGYPLTGSYDTLIITASSALQNQVRPLIAGALQDLIDARFTRYDQDQQADIRHRPQTLLFVDDMPGQALTPNFMQTLLQSGSQGLPVCASFHDFGQLRARYGEEGESAKTLFGNLQVYRGIRDRNTLHDFSELIGSDWTEVSSYSEGESGGSLINTLAGGATRTKTAGVSTSEQLIPQMPPHKITQGHPENGYQNDYVLSFLPNGWRWTKATPYFSHPLWVKALVASMEYLGRQGRQYPVPLLDRDGTGYLETAGGQPLVERYLKWKDRLNGGPGPDDESDSEEGRVPA